MLMRTACNSMWPPATESNDIQIKRRPGGTFHHAGPAIAKIKWHITNDDLAVPLLSSWVFRVWIWVSRERICVFVKWI